MQDFTQKQRAFLETEQDSTKTTTAAGTLGAETPPGGRSVNNSRPFATLKVCPFENWFLVHCVLVFIHFFSRCVESTAVKLTFKISTKNIAAKWPKFLRVS